MIQFFVNLDRYFEQRPRTQNRFNEGRYTEERLGVPESAPEQLAAVELCRDEDIERLTVGTLDLGEGNM